MSELIAEARVLIRPDLTGFRAALEAEVLTAAKGVAVPVAVTPVLGGTGATQAAAALQTELASQTTAAAAATTAETEALATNTAATTRNTVATAANADAQAGATVARERGAASLAAQSHALAGVGKGAGSAAAGLLGVRGATLAATGPFLAGAAAAITLTKAVQSAAQLESELNVFRVTAGATADEMKRVSEEAQALGRDVTLPAVGAQDAAEAMTELSKAGLSVQDSLDGARGVLQLATAAAISNADAVQIAASALNAFGLAGDQAVHVADVLTNASNLAQGSIADVGLSLQQAAAVAKQVGLSFEDTIALLTELQRAGIRGSDAGTSLRVSLIKLIAPSKKAAEVLDELNIHIRDAAGNVRPDVFNQFAAAQANLTRKQQDANAAIVFGTDGLRAYSIIARQGLPALNEVRTELDRQGSAAELAGARLTGVAGASENLKNQLEALGITIGQIASPAVEDLATGLAEVVSQANDAAGGLVHLRQVIRDTFPKESGDSGSAGFFKRLSGNIRDLVTGSLPQQLSRFGDEIVNFQSQLEDLTGLDLVIDPKPAEQGLQQFDFSLQGFLDRTKQLFSDAGQDAGKAFGDQAAVGVSQSLQGALDLAVAQATGTQAQQLQILLAQRARQQTFLNRVLARPQATTQKEADRNAKLAIEAAQNLERTRGAIKSIFSQQNAAATKLASDIRTARQKADQAIIDAITGADIRFQRAVDIARAQGGPGALVKALTALQQQQDRDIKKAQAAIKDDKTLQSTLRQLRAARFQTAQDLIAAQEAQQQAVEESFQKRVTFAELQAQLTGNDTVLVKAINAYIKYLRTVALPAAKKAKQGVIDVKTEIERLLVQRKELAKTVEGESPDVFAARLFQQAADQFRRFGSNIATSSAGLLSPQAARGQFAANLLGPTGQAEAVAVRQRDSQLAESKKQTALLQVIARGPRREIKGVTVPKATQETVANIAANVLRGL